MKKMTSPKTKVFHLSVQSWCSLSSSFMSFHKQPHSPFFRDFVMASPGYQDALSLADFSPIKPVKSVDVIINYE